MYVDNESIYAARNADLYSFLLARHPGQFVKEGRSLRLKANKSISIKEGFHAYRDFSSGEYGNAVTFLTKYMGYRFQDAVISLNKPVFSQDGGTAVAMPAASRTINLPPAAPLPHRRMYAFLIGRGIPKESINDLVSRGLAYQSDGTNNVVFVNRERDYCEIRGTYTFAEKQFHGCRKSRADRFWYYLPGNGRPDTAFVTEGAIDAISLCILHRKSGIDISKSVYISIGGVDNNLTINRIKHRIHTILAVDNDRAGELCRQRHKELSHILPFNKDWNDDLRNLPTGRWPCGQ